MCFITIENPEMKLIVYFIVIVLVSCSPKEDECDGIFVHTKIHRKQILVRGLNRPYSLSCYKSHHVIFFSHNVGKQKDDKFQIAFIDKDHERPVAINSVKNGFATAVNNEMKEAYLGGSEGIRLYPLNVQSITQPGNNIKHDLVLNHDIWYLFHHDNVIYFITYPKLRLHKRYVKENETYVEEVDEIPEKISQFVIDGDGDTFITNNTGLFRIKKDEKHRIRIDGNYKEFRAVAVNSTGHVYLAGGSSLYTVNKHKNEIEEIAIIAHIFGLTFDKDDHIIYSNPHQIVKLLPGC